MIRTTNSKIVKAIAGTIVEMHPYHNPENMDKIMSHVVTTLDKHYFIKYKRKDNFQIFRFKDRDELYSFIQELLNIKEFRELNISKYLKDQGVNNADDERNSISYLTSIHDRKSIEFREYDFIDLDACIQNITSELIDISEESECFLCKYAEYYGSSNPSKDNEVCKLCCNNPNYKNNQEFHPMARKPHNEWTDEEKEKYSF